jgi:hypothetical protein
MAPDRDRKNRKERKDAPEEFEVAYYTNELGRPLQRKLLQRQFAQLSDSNIKAAAHGEESSPEGDSVLPREDRAG